MKIKANIHIILGLLIMFSAGKVLGQKTRNFQQIWIESKLKNIDNPVYLIQVKDSSLFYIPNNSLESKSFNVIEGKDIIEVRVEGKNKYMAGAVLGFLGGSVLGGFLGNEIGQSNCGFDPDDFAQAAGQRLCVVGTAFIGGLVGAILGSVSGGFIQKRITRDQVYIIDGKNYNLQRYKSDLEMKIVVF